LCYERRLLTLKEKTGEKVKVWGNNDEMLMKIKLMLFIIYPDFSNMRLHTVQAANAKKDIYVENIC